MATKKTNQPIHGPIRASLEKTISILEAAGLLANVDAARIEIARSLATVLDVEPGSPQLWREYRSAEQDLRKDHDAQRDPFDDLLAHLSAQVRDEEKPKKTKPRT